jgi:glutamine---fructose-6-phosphate transaminase (isomerizing)
MEKIPYPIAVETQPENLAIALESLTQALAGLGDLEFLPGETVGVIAMGASTNSAHALVTALTMAGIRGVNITASDLELAVDGFQPADHYVIVSESGRSPEPIQAARALTPGTRIGITNVPNAPIAEVLDHVLPLGGFGDSPVYTIGYTATLLAYDLLVRAACPATKGLEGNDPAQIPKVVQDALAAYRDVSRQVGHWLENTTAIDFVGRGYSFASAAEGALVFREAARVPTAAFETYQYLHGPMESLNPQNALIVFGDSRELTMVDSALSTGAKTILITAADKTDIDRLKHENLHVLQLPAGISGFTRAIVETVIIQLIAENYADNAGLTIEEFLLHQGDTKLDEPMTTK